MCLHGLELKPCNAGLVAKDRYSHQTAKASIVDRGLSLKKLGARFGTYQTAKHAMPKSTHRYCPVPLHKVPNRNKLWKEFQEQRLTLTGEIEKIRLKWEQHREALKQKSVAHMTRTRLMKTIRQYEAEEIHRARMEQGTSNWLGFLQEKASAGDDAALAVLRSRKEIVPERSHHELMQPRADYLSRRTAVLEHAALSVKIKDRLTSAALMKSLIPRGIQN